MKLEEFWKWPIIRLNIGCGFRPKPKEEGWINIDFDFSCNPDLVWDIRNGLPFKNDSVEEFYLSHVLEHFTPEQFVYVIREIWRTGKRDSVVKIIVPMWNSIGAHDLDHRMVVTRKTFEIWESGKSGVQSYNLTTLGFMFFKIKEIIEDNEGKINPEFQMYVTLEVDK